MWSSLFCTEIYLYWNILRCLSCFVLRYLMLCCLFCTEIYATVFPVCIEINDFVFPVLYSDLWCYDLCPILISMTKCSPFRNDIYNIVCSVHVVWSMMLGVPCSELRFMMSPIFCTKICNVVRSTMIFPCPWTEIYCMMWSALFCTEILMLCFLFCVEIYDVCATLNWDLQCLVPRLRWLISIFDVPTYVSFSVPRSMMLCSLFGTEIHDVVFPVWYWDQWCCVPCSVFSF